MLRVLLVLLIIVFGGLSAARGPFEALLFYCWYAYFRPEQWVWSDWVSSLNLSLVTGVWLLVSSLGSMSRFRWRGQTILIACMLLQSTISMVLSEHPDWSLSYWIEFVKVLVVTGLISFLVADAQKFRTMLLVIVYSLGFEAAKQGWAQLILNPGAPNNNIHPVLGDNNGVAAGMMMLIPLGAALVMTSTRIWERWLHGFFIVGFFYRGLSTYSRGGFIAAAVVGTVLFLEAKRKVRVAVIGLAMVFVFVAIMPDRFWDRMQTITSSDQQRDDSAGGRLFFWGTAVQMANSNPLTGVGFNGFTQSFNDYDASDGAYGKNRAVHSAWFGALAEMGYPGLLVLVSVVVVSVRSCIGVRRLVRRSGINPDIRVYAGALRTSFLAYVVGMTFLNGQYNEMFWHLVGLSAAVAGIATDAAAEAGSVYTMKEQAR